MSEERQLRVVKQLKGMPVQSSAGEPLGQIADVFVQPTEGRWLGLLLLTPGGLERAVAAESCVFARKSNVVITSEFALASPLEFARTQPHGVPVCRQLIGTQIVTEPGELLGFVSEVLLRFKLREITYHVATADWRRWFKLGFYLAGNVPRFYSKLGARLIVPALTQKDFAANELTTRRPQSPL